MIFFWDHILTLKFSFGLNESNISIVSSSFILPIVLYSFIFNTLDSTGFLIIYIKLAASNSSTFVKVHFFKF